jgi:hypothetical protein
MGWMAPSPVFGHGWVYATSGKDGPTLAIRPGGKGDVTATQIALAVPARRPLRLPPVLYGNYLYGAQRTGAVQLLRGGHGYMAIPSADGGEDLRLIGGRGRQVVLHK